MCTFLVASDVYLRPWGAVTLAMTVSVLLLFATSADAIPVITFPINSQVPPVARISEPFTYTFSSSTFTSQLSITYSMSNAPSWLSLDGSTRTLSGTPPKDEANTAPDIDITASDSTGSVTMSATLVISGDPAPTVFIPLEDQLESFGSFSPPTSLLYYVSTPFSFSFDSKTFGDNQLNYYAVTSDNTPLPSWISFDGSSLTFSGQTPPDSSLIQPPETFEIQLIASDVLGFAGTAIPFDIVVGIHKLNFLDEFHTINATVGTAISFEGLRGTLRLDDQAAINSDILVITAITPEWLTFDNSSLVLSGTPPSNAQSYNITVTAFDIYQDVASAVVELNIATQLFSKPLGSINATIGKTFSMNLNSSLVNPEDVAVSAQIDLTNTWLSFDPKTLILNGTVPSNVQPSNVEVNFNATSKSTQQSESEILSVRLVRGSQTTNSPTRTSATSSPTITTAAAETAPTSSKKTLGKGDIAAIIILLTFLIILVLICLCLYKRRKYLASQRPKTPEKGDISRPTHMQGSDTAVDVMEKSLHKPDISNTFADISYVTSKRRTGQSGRRTQTESAISYNGSEARDSRSTSARARSFSANAVSEYDSSWRSTQDSAYPRLPSTRVSKTARNFSKKTDEFEATSPLRRDESSEFPMRQSELAFAPLRRLSRSSIQQTPNIVYDSENIRESQKKTRQRAPNYLGGVPDVAKRASGIGHGSRKSVSGLSVTSDGRRSAGLGPGPAPLFTSASGSEVPVRRNTSSWQTIEPEEPVETRRSTISALTESTGVLELDPLPTAQYLTVRQVLESPGTIKSPLLSSSGSRTESKRAVGSSPFFAGSSRSGSGRDADQIPKSLHQREGIYRISATRYSEKTQESLEQTILKELRHIEPTSPLTPFLQRDALGIGYTSPQEGTRELHNLAREMSNGMSNHLSKAFRQSLIFSDSDSRFRSAEPSPVSKAERDGGAKEHPYEHEHYGYPSEGQRFVMRNDDDDESFVYNAPAVELPSMSNPHSSAPPRVREAKGRFLPGPRRPISIDSTSRKKSLTTQYSGILEGDGENDTEANRSDNVAFL